MLNNLKCEHMPDLPTKCMNILRKNNEVEEIERAVAILVADQLLEFYQPIAIPTDKPDMLIQFENKEPLERLEFEKKYPDWKIKTGVDFWVKKRDGAIRQNESNLHWLNKWAELLKDDLVRNHKLRDAIDLYENVPHEARPQVNKVKEVFAGSVQSQFLLGEEE